MWWVNNFSNIFPVTIAVGRGNVKESLPKQDLKVINIKANK
jgi:hypothetical protein